MTRLGYADDRRLRPALKVLADKRRPDGTWVLDKVHPDVDAALKQDYEGKELKRWSLEREGKPSKWITLTALTVLKRVEDAR